MLRTGAVDAELARRVRIADHLAAHSVVARPCRARPAPSRGTRAGRRSGRRSPARACRAARRDRRRAPSVRPPRSAMFSPIVSSPFTCSAGQRLVRRSTARRAPWRAPRTSCASSGVHQSRSRPCGVELAALVVEAVRQLVADHAADRAVVDRRIGVGVEDRRLQDAGRERRCRAASRCRRRWSAASCPSRRGPPGPLRRAGVEAPSRPRPRGARRPPGRRRGIDHAWNSRAACRGSRP